MVEARGLSQRNERSPGKESGPGRWLLLGIAKSLKLRATDYLRSHAALCHNLILPEYYQNTTRILPEKNANIKRGRVSQAKGEKQYISAS